MKLPAVLTWDWFCEQTMRRWPDSAAPPHRGCWREATQWLTEQWHLQEARHLLLTAPGNRAAALYYYAARAGLIRDRQATGV